jgi:anti-sigma regulatory factor (Ser/Thr protein kinase)
VVTRWGWFWRAGRGYPGGRGTSARGGAVAGGAAGWVVVPRCAMAGDAAGGGSPAGADGPGRTAAGSGVLLDMEFTDGLLYAVRQAVAAHAAAAGMSGARARDVTLAVHELASNAVRHGAGRGRLRMRVRDGTLACEVQDAGREPRGGRSSAGDAGADAAAGWPYAQGHGLWLVRLLADQMSVVSGPAGTCVTVRFALG